MSTEPSPTRRVSAFTVILLSPLRAIERARGWRRLGLLALYGLMVLLCWALLWRQVQLDGLPDVGEPFGATARRTFVRVPDDRNAFVPYRRAAQRFRDLNESEGRSFTNANLLWSAADATLRGWVAEHHEAISLLREGSERPEACLEEQWQPRRSIATYENVKLLVRLSWIGTAALFEAGRLRAKGDRTGAWNLFKAVVLASRHMARAAPAANGRGTAIIMVQYARGPVAAWAEDPAVGVTLLRRALDDLAAAEALTPPLSHAYHEEYLNTEESLGDLQPLIVDRASRRAKDDPFDTFANAPSLGAFLRREPERSRRVLRLLVANDLAWCDRPASERPGFAVPRLHIYEPGPAAPPATRALSPEALARWADSALLAPAQLWRLGELEKLDHIDRWSLGLLKEAVAVPLFTREMGRPPLSTAEALRRYLPMPGDAPDRDEAEPVPQRAGEVPRTPSTSAGKPGCL
jgi:hypothetical protein